MKGKFILVCLYVFGLTWAFGQVPPPPPPPPPLPPVMAVLIIPDTIIEADTPEISPIEKALQSEAPAYHPIDKQTWAEETRDMNFDETRKPEKVHQVEPDLDIPEPLISGEALKIIVFIAIAILLLYILYRIFGKGILRNPALKPAITEIKDDLEERPMESDLDGYLRQALASKDYKLAVRIYYLMLLRALHTKNIIQWRKEKTNYDYLRELHKHPEIHKLNYSTMLFEYIWYGDKQVDESEFKHIQPGFTTLIDKINKV